MRGETRPYWLRRLYDRAEERYTRHFLEPQFDAAGPGLNVSKPWYVELWGRNIVAGDRVHIRATADQRVRLCAWDHGETSGAIHIGDYALISPGVRIGSSARIEIGRNTMIASRAYITDSDWHDTYDRTAEHDKVAPVKLEENVWVGDSAIIAKGVTIGENAIIGAGSVVVTNIPANCIAAGNPAKPLRQLEPDHPFRKRSDLFADPDQVAADLDRLQRYVLKDNTFLTWLRAKFAPTRED